MGTDRATGMPKRVWIDPSNLSVHFEAALGRVVYVQPPAREKKPHPHYKTDTQIEEIRRLSDAGMLQKDIAAKLDVHPRTVRKYAGRRYWPKG